MKRIFQLSAILVMVGTSAMAQLTRGFISGTVSDSSGAVMPQVRVTVAEKSTGIRHEGFTNGAGVYRFAALESGIYTVTMSKEGFETVSLAEIEVGTAQEVILNQTLPLTGSVASVSVDSATAGAQLSKATPTVERTIVRETLESLPFFGWREVADVALLSPGVARTGSGATQATYSANGQRPGANTITVDGLDNKDSQYQFITDRTLPEGTAEVQVRTNSYSAEFGRGLGAQVSIVTRAGTNQFHAQAWDYFGSSVLSAATLANKSAGLTSVRFTDHQTGGSLGGPLLRNRTFFFALYQYVPHREGVSANGIGSITIPTLAGFAALSRVPLGPGQTEQGRQAILSSLAFLPEIYSQVRRYDSIRSVPVNGLAIESGTTRIGLVRASDSTNAQVRVDHRISDHDSLTYRFSEGIISAPVAAFWPFSNNTFGRRFASSEDDRTQQHSVSFTRIFTPTLINEVRLSALRHRDEVLALEDSGRRTVIMGSFTLGPAGVVPFLRPRNSYEAQDVLTWTRGRHSLKFGAHLLWVDDTISGTQQNIWNFTNFSDFLNNQANSLSVRQGAFVQRILSVRQNYFIQDDLKLRPDLTVNLGVRYQTANTPEGLFGATRPEIAATGVPGPVHPDRNDVAPRFGLAYSPTVASGPLRMLLGNGETVLRGGYGIGYGLAYEGEVGSSLLSLSSNYPWSVTLNLDRTQLANAFPATPALLPQAASFNPFATFTNYREHAKNPTSHFYSVSMQREFKRQYILELGYLGSRSYHLFANSEANPESLTAAQAALVISTKNASAIPSRTQRSLNPQWGPRTILETSAYSKYNAGYVRFDRRFSRGLLIGANYTWSASLGLGESDIRAQNTQDNRSEYARSSLDVPHRFIIHYVWQTPGRRVYGGWRLSGTSEWQSGRPFSIVTGVDSNGDGNSASDRPNYNPAGKISLDPVTGDWRSFTTPLDGTGLFVTPLGNNGLPLQYTMPNGGNLGRNTFRGPAFTLWNMSLMKPFRLGERVQLELRGDANNLFNHRNFGAPVNSMNSANFGQNASTPPSRVLLLSAKLRF